MGRKSLAKQRREEILDAFERCILKYGLEDSSLERVAQEGGKSRNIIRHYVGNRDELIAALVGRTVLKIQQGAADILANVPKTQLIPHVLDFLFWERSAEEEGPDFGDRLMSGLWRAREHQPLTQQILLNFYQELEAIFTAGLSQLYPDTPVEPCRTVAYAIICLAETNWVLLDLGVDGSRNQMARQAAETLLQSLEAYP